MSTSIPMRLIAFGIALLFVFSAWSVADEMAPDVLEYYITNVKRAIAVRNPVDAGTTYSYTATTHYKFTDSHGAIGRVDTISAKFFYSWGKLDSTVTISGNLAELEPFVSEYDDIFDQDYLFNTFPNDTGGIDLAIGFDTPDDTLPYPIGLLIINRDNFVPRWLYLSYPEKKGFDRFSKSWRFTEQEGLIFPDSVWIVAAKSGIFGVDEVRVETGISDLEISRPGEE